MYRNRPEISETPEYTGNNSIGRHLLCSRVWFLLWPAAIANVQNQPYDAAGQNHFFCQGSTNLLLLTRALLPTKPEYSRTLAAPLLRHGIVPQAKLCPLFKYQFNEKITVARFCRTYKCCYGIMHC